MTKFKAIIFDMDGVLVDTEHYYYARRKAFLDSKGISIAHLSPLNFIGGNMKQVWHMILRDDYDKWDVPALQADYLQYKLDNLMPYAELLFPDAKRTLDDLQAKGYKLGLASSTAKLEILRALKMTELLPYFKVILSGDDFKESKPNPEIYQVAMAKLGVIPAETLIIEDSEKGIAAGVDSKATVWAIKDTVFGLDQSRATTLFDTLTEISQQL
ncbi:phosphatase [Lactococcus hodotermopsidis]|uniref:Phosphatase n=1 Tax=Pseudolactococcus hodotermopsidis TaxID=2709157 RepID=A0A6A0BGQ8_9LACT|nr:HAD family phosphatase [Lactococcus hodotermopsidis]GFH42967.1 phosphatase [Lactococcus hodotermopsidis]